MQSLLLSLVPENGEAIGVLRLRDLAAATLGQHFERDEFETALAALLESRALTKGRRNSIQRVMNEVRDAAVRPDFTLATLVPPPPKAKQEALPLASSRKPALKHGVASGEDPHIVSYRHPDKRKNNPEVGMVSEATDPTEPRTTWRYDPHLDPSLQFDIGRVDVEKLIDDALASGDPDTMRAALEELKRAGSPYLNWAGKAERTSFEVDTVSLHVHERVDPMSILAAVSKQIKAAKAGKRSSAAIQPGLFDAPFENLPLRDAVDFYKHERGWANRLIAGDSLLVMNSLLQKEGLAGQVQMIYLDPPYGIKYGSNFQPFVGKRDVKDRKDEDLTQEPEMIKAFRDTWELGIHSYLTYLRDRLLLARELLSESGSVFVQISDENLHHVREIVDELFGIENFIATVTFSKTSSQTSELLPGISDYLVWYAKDVSKIAFKALYKEIRDKRRRWIRLFEGQAINGSTRDIWPFKW